MSSFSPRVSVLTTVYTREKFLRDCIERIQARRSQDHKHIVVVDGSTDASQAIAADLVQGDGRIQFHINPSNLGNSPNRNRAASLGIGEHLKYLDADHWLGRWALEVMVDAMDLFPKTGWGLIHDGHRSHPQPTFVSGQKALNLHGSGTIRLFHRSPLNVIMRTCAFQKVGGFIEDRMVSYFDMWHRLAREYPVMLFPNGNNLYQHHEGQETAVNSTDPLTGFRNTLISLEQLDNSCTPISPELITKAFNRLTRELTRTILVHIKNGRWSSEKRSSTNSARDGGQS